VNDILHIAARVSSSNEKKTAYTASGLGDRIHLLTLAWAYSNANSKPVLLHISSNGMNAEKQNSFFEILQLFPKGSINFVVHDYIGIDEICWLRYLEKKGINAKLFYYGDHLGRYEKKLGFDATPYLREFPKLKEPHDIKSKLRLPKRYITVQWDSTAQTRTLKPNLRNAIEDSYRQLGYVPITLGGMSTSYSKKKPLSHAAYAMSKAQLHIGVDSGFMHLAFLYLDFSKIHIYADANGFWAHHLFRAYENGCVQNLYHNNPNTIQRIRIKIMYDSQLMNKLLFSHPSILTFLRQLGRFTKYFRARL